MAFEHISQQEIKRFLAKQLNEIMKMHNAIGTLEDGKHVFLLRGKERDYNYEVTIERVKDKIYGREAGEIIIDDDWKGNDA